jgi:hypothetical protein
MSGLFFAVSGIFFAAAMSRLFPAAMSGAIVFVSIGHLFV